MRIRNRLLWMTIPLLFACNMKDGSSRSTSSEQNVGGQAFIEEKHPIDSMSYSSTIVGDSVVLVISTCDTPNSEQSHTNEIAIMISESNSNVNYSNTPINLTDKVLVPAENTDSFDVELCAKNVFDSELVQLDSVEKSISSELPTSELAIDSLLGNTPSLDNRISEKVENYITRRGMIRRDATKTVFIPKGQWMIGGQLSWKQWNNDNLSYLLLQDLHFSGYSFSAGPYLGYFFAKNMAVGCRFSYDRSFLNLGEAGLTLGEGLSFSLNDFYYLQQSYKSSVFLRSYIPIGESRIFGLFGELQLNHTFSEWKSTMGRDDLLKGVYQHTQSLGIGFGGGLVVFLTDFAAAEVMLNVGECNYKWGYQDIKEIDKRDKGQLNSSKADFRINLFSIKFGVTFYL